MATIAKALPVRVERARRNGIRPLGPAAGRMLGRVAAALDPREYWRAFRGAVEQSDGNWTASTTFFR